MSPALAALALETFDNAVASGDLHYAPSVPEHIVHNSLPFQFRLAPVLLPKPLNLSPTSAERNPFLHLAPSEIVAPIPPAHSLIVNKFSVLRPSLLLLTTAFAPQSDDLDDGDLDAAWEVLNAGGDWLAAYNCGVEAGCSQGHRHVQFVPREGFDGFPEGVEVPFVYFLGRVVGGREEVRRVYRGLLRDMRDKMLGRGVRGYNLLFTERWMLVIPRRRGNVDGVGANSFGMVGRVWVKNEEERRAWEVGGYTEMLEKMGVPKEDGRGSC